ncbi:MAG: transposase [Nitrososphaeraceae archaeon]
MFFFDILVRKVSIFKNTRPVVRITGSHQQSSRFGAISLDGRQLFRQFEKFNEDTFCEFLKYIHHKFPKCYLFLDKAPQHYKSHKVRTNFEEHKDSLIPVYLPTASPEFRVLEECWNISKNDLLVLTYYPSFRDFRMKIEQYFRTKRFKFNMLKYLTGYGS